MARITSLDTLGEVRRAKRILKRLERWLVQCERDELRRARKAREREGLAKPSAQELQEQA